MASEQFMEFSIFSTCRGDATLVTLMKFMISQRDRHDDANPEVINFILNYLLPPPRNITGFSIDDIRRRINRLQEFTSLLLKIPLSLVHETGIITVGSEAIANFESIVLYTLQSIKKLLSEGKCKCKDELIDEFYFYDEPLRHEAINLGLSIWPALMRVIGPSLDQSRLFCDSLTQSIRMISILYELNEHWSTLFCNLSTQLLIPKSAFECIDLLSYLRNTSLFFETNHHFMVKSHVRKLMLKDHISLMRAKPLDYDNRILFSVNRKHALVDVMKSLRLYDVDRWALWDFNFQDEIGRGDGPTKEFYTKVSLDCSRYDLDLWIGEPMTSKDGNVYVSSPCGLFPSPCTNLDKRSKQVLRTIGKLMAKSMLDGRLMDLNFSKALYKCMFAQADCGQYLKLSDIKYVMPSLSKFIEGMVDIMKETHLIKADSSLTSDQRSERISSLMYDGCHLEDLCINFTVPGFPEIEMIEGGSNITLAAENVDDYLSLLAWWLLYKGPQLKFIYLRKGFNSILSTGYFKHVQVEDIEQIFCGIKAEPWIYDDLQQNCQLEDGMTVNTPVIKKLFQVMTEFSSEDRELFLKFVTGSAKLPSGGLENIQPKLTIKRIVRNSDTDARFPSSMTCFNTLFLPDYSTLDILRERLAKAIRDGAESFHYV